MAEFLDCTLRDGGYYTNWDFSPALIDVYINSFNDLPVDYLEVGYRSNPMREYLGEFFYCPPAVLQDLRKDSNKKLAVILNEKDVRAADAPKLLGACTETIDLVRLAVDPKNFQRSIDLGSAVKELGFELSFNLMYMSDWSQYTGLFNQMRKLEGVADYLYMVDSYGGVFPQDIKETIKRIREHTTTPLGFHGHNNLELGLINTLTAIGEGVEIVDSTVTGMGRGAGNLKTELLLTVLHARGEIDLDFNALAQVTDAFEDLKLQHQWGTQLPYMVSGAHSLPQKQVMDWVTKRFYSLNSILRALHNRSKGWSDNQRLPRLDISDEKSYTRALIIGGGPTAIHHAPAVKTFLKKYPDTIIIHASSRNAMSFAELKTGQLYCLVGNEGRRLESVFGGVAKIKGKCILPPYPREMGTYVPSTLENRAFELQRITFTDRLKDTHTTIALQTAMEMGLQDVFLVGYDGYNGTEMGQKEQDLLRENEFLFRQAGEQGLKCISLTPTNYEQVTQDSIYSYII